jgi:DNA gyrase subunit A
MVMTDDGVAKISPLEEYPTQGRAGSGVITMKLPNGSRGLAAATIGAPNDNIMVVSDIGRVWQLKIAKAPVGKRAGKGDYILSVTGKEHIFEITKPQPQVVVMEANGGEVVEE